MIIRPIKDTDIPFMYDFVEKAFSTAYVSDGNEPNYASESRASASYIKELEHVVEEDGRVVGDVILSKFNLPYNVNALLLNIACIDISFRNKGLGQSLIEVALTKAIDMGYDVVFVAGGPKFYNKMGFKQSLEYGLKNTNGYDDRYILCKELRKGALDNISGPFDFAI
ncbi:MAG: N-acetyltransferase [Clostridia bacterium]|nr:N-acetyltransferase [Clostridia bacterium]